MNLCRNSYEHGYAEEMVGHYSHSG